jgi:phosphoglycolate phosphatase-like HAD superfamily hydrolase
MMKKEKLILFDIDGTLLVIDTLADLAFRAMTKDVYGLECSFKEINYAGMTDPRILEEVLKLRGIDDETIAVRYDEAIEKYCSFFDYFARCNSCHVTIYPGVIQLLAALEQMPEMQIAILTGNLEYTGWKKLELAGLKNYFPFGVFGSDSKVRSELVGIALKRAEDKYGITYKNKNVIIIGDSPHDVLCGKPFGVTSIAVATGHSSAEELKRYEPDYVFRDLGDYERVLEVIRS